MKNYEFVNKSLTYDFIKPFFDYHTIYFPVHLCKYYNDNEKRIKNVPDVLDVIDDEIDKFYDFIDARKKAAMTNSQTNIDTNFTPKELKTVIEYLEELRESIINGTDEFYTYFEPHLYHFAGEEGNAIDAFKTYVIPIKCIKMNTLYRPVFNRTTCKWSAELDTNESRKEGILIENKYALYNGLDKNIQRNGRHIAAPWQIDIWSYYIDIESMAVAENESDILALNEYDWAICKKCRRIFRTFCHKEDYRKSNNENKALQYCRKCRADK